MAARKLQTEIDKTLKKVSEGVEQFEDQYKKIQQTANPAHKEKLEAELKTQIKKLQRLRDQIKTWLASNEIKDKKVLTDNRKLIETQMEKFKACEKEMKTKAFSKEGLSAASKLDPKEQLKLETGAWLSTQVDELSRQVEMTEAEVEQLQGGAKKSKKGGSTDRVSELEAHNERRKWHVSRLELINRLMENGNLEPDRVSALREDISYFVESNTEEDFEEDELIYDDLNLDEEEEAFGLAADDIQSSHDSMSIADTSDLPPPTRTPVKASAPKVSTASRDTIGEADGERSPTAVKTRVSSSSVPQRKPTLDGTAPRPAGLSASSRVSSSAVPSISTASSAAASKDSAPTPGAPAPRAVPAVLPPIRYSAAAASAVNPSTPAASTASGTSSQSAAQALGLAAASIPSPAVAATAAAAQVSAAQVASPTSVTSPPVSVPAPSTAARETSAPSAPSPQVTRASLPSAASSTAPPSEVSPSPAPSHASIIPNNMSDLTPSPAPTAADSSSILSPSQQAASLAPLQALEVGSQPQQQQQSMLPPGVLGPDASPNTQQRSIQQSLSLAGPTSPQAGSATSEPRLPSSLADLVTSFESAKQKSLRRDNDLSAIQDILDAGYPNIPQPSDAEKPKYYIPRNPYPTPHYYPQQPSPHLANPSLFAKFDVDTLFYIFYYCQGTYMQYLAAQELKKQSWRFHKQYLTWFQRANEPQAITDEYEQGVYLYFDFEGSWAQRRKENFSFFYRHLEE